MRPYGECLQACGDSGCSEGGRIPALRVHRGFVNPDWGDSAGRGPDHCRRLLEDDGVRFVGDHVGRSQRVAWDELRRRDGGPPIPRLVCGQLTGSLETLIGAPE